MLSKRAELIRAAIFAHLFGLSVVGFYGTIGTSGGFGNGAWAGMLAGGIISIPWFAVLLAVIWFFSKFYWQNFLLLSIFGPTLVCGSWWLLDGSTLLDAVALTSIVDSIAFLAIISFVRWRAVKTT
jgi:hypothetical protein